MSEEIREVYLRLALLRRRMIEKYSFAEITLILK